MIKITELDGEKVKAVAICLKQKEKLFNMFLYRFAEPKKLWMKKHTKHYWRNNRCLGFSRISLEGR